MPVKRRADKGGRLDEYRREMLRDGPHAMLLAGCGYLGEVWPAITQRPHPRSIRSS